MVNHRVRQMEKAAREAIESIYYGLATVTEFQKVEDEDTYLTEDEPVVVLTDEPCRLSFEQTKATDQTDTAADISLGIKLFISPDVTIKPGSLITVTQDGRTADFAVSGVPAYYASHQEIDLELVKEYA